MRKQKTRKSVKSGLDFFKRTGYNEKGLRKRGVYDEKETDDCVYVRF